MTDDERGGARLALLRAEIGADRQALTVHRDTSGDLDRFEATLAGADAAK